MRSIIWVLRKLRKERQNNERNCPIRIFERKITSDLEGRENGESRTDFFV